MSTPHHYLTIGSTLNDRYSIVGMVGKGGFGVVYEAEDLKALPDQDHRVAIKVLSNLASPVEKEGFKQEADKLTHIKYETIPRIRDYFELHDCSCLVMQYIEGKTLKSELERRGQPFPVNQVLKWADSLLKTLEYLHRFNPPLIHRDIKPDNLKLKNENEVMLLDFGIAKGGLPTHHKTKIKAGTEEYSPPEQLACRPTDARSDLYALGATLYHLLTNQSPETATTRGFEMHSRRPDPLKPANHLNPDVSPQLAAVLTQAMALDPKKRFQSATEMHQCIVPPPPPPLPPHPPPPPPKPASKSRWAVPLIMIVLIALAVWWFLARKQASIELIEVYMNDVALDVERLPELTGGERVSLKVAVIDTLGVKHQVEELQCRWSVAPLGTTQEINTDYCETFYDPTTKQSSQTLFVEVKGRNAELRSSDSMTLTFNIKN